MSNLVNFFHQKYYSDLPLEYVSKVMGHPEILDKAINHIQERVYPNLTRNELVSAHAKDVLSKVDKMTPKEIKYHELILKLHGYDDSQHEVSKLPHTTKKTYEDAPPFIISQDENGNTVYRKPDENAKYKHEWDDPEWANKRHDPMFDIAAQKYGKGLQYNVGADRDANGNTVISPTPLSLQYNIGGKLAPYLSESPIVKSNDEQTSAGLQDNTRGNFAIRAAAGFNPRINIGGLKTDNPNLSKVTISPSIEGYADIGNRNRFYMTPGIQPGAMGISKQDNLVQHNLPMNVQYGATGKIGIDYNIDDKNSFSLYAKELLENGKLSPSFGAEYNLKSGENSDIGAFLKLNAGYAPNGGFTGGITIGQQFGGSGDFYTKKKSASKSKKAIHERRVQTF